MPCTQPSVSGRIMNSSRRQICGQSSKKQSRKNSTISKLVHIDANTKAATILINTGIMAVFHSTKCQRWDCNTVHPPRQIYACKVHSQYHSILPKHTPFISTQTSLHHASRTARVQIVLFLLLYPISGIFLLCKGTDRTFPSPVPGFCHFFCSARVQTHKKRLLYPWQAGLDTGYWLQKKILQEILCDSISTKY